MAKASANEETMNWLQKIAYNYTAYVNNKGTIDPTWQPKFDEIRNRRLSVAQQALKVAEGLGHIMSGWSPMDRSRCRKCGRMLYLRNIHSQVSARSSYAPSQLSQDQDFEGAASYEKCDVRFDNPEYQFSEFRYSNDVGNTVY